MSGRFALITLGTVAALGYVGAYRLGQWLDQAPDQPPNNIDRYRTNPPPSLTTGWYRWTYQQREP